MKMIKRFSAILISLILTIFTPLSFSADASYSALWPLDSQYQNITTYFNPERNYNDYSGAHNAIDISADYSANIYAVHDGVCISADWKGDYGYLIILWHEDLNLYTFYAHCSSMAVYDGQTVQQGDVIGYVGSTGVSSGNHLHFGICDSLLGGFPSVTYYDPLTCFTYGGSNNNTGNDNSNNSECSCSFDYSGLYTTKNVETYLNIRSGHGSNYESLGKISPNSELRVIKSDGEWAHIEYNGINGFCSMEFLEKTEDIISDMNISEVSLPLGKMEVGSKFSISGFITSNLPIKHIWGGVYESDGVTESETFEAFPDNNCLEYDLSESFDKQICFNRLDSGSYIYRIEAEDETGEKFTLINSIFYVGEDENKISGDINNDGAITISDLVLLQSYLLGISDFNTEQYIYADINKDSLVDFCDMIMMRKKIVESLSKI